MKRETTKQKLINATLELSEIYDNIDRITSRDISKKSGINLALINYHFDTKENLLRLVAEIKLNSIIKSTIEEFDESLSAYDKIKKLLLDTASFAFENINSFKVISRYEMNVGCIHSLELFRPYFQEHLPDTEEGLLTIILLRLLVFYHTIILSPEDYGKVLGVDFFDDLQRNEFLTDMLNMAIHL
ncbi:MAG: TetR family transcriptional regulator [Vallitaleaceae bacterium]|nr:TetR family transcriptional regulator [Vallitaleaceae bacterium]